MADNGVGDGDRVGVGDGACGVGGGPVVFRGCFSKRALLSDTHRSASGTDMSNSSVPTQISATATIRRLHPPIAHLRRKRVDVKGPTSSQLDVNSAKHLSFPSSLDGILVFAVPHGVAHVGHELRQTLLHRYLRLPS
jgi:hypothetical protein